VYPTNWPERRGTGRRIYNPRMTLGRAWALALGLYTALEFASPAVPGAFVFDVQESVDGIRASRPRDEASRAPAVAAPAPVRPAREASAVRPTERRLVSPQTPRPHARSAPAVEPRPVDEDH
jgi:hypothetical protein